VYGCRSGEGRKQWLSFNVREDFLRGLAVGTTVDVVRQGASEATPAVVTELLPLGAFATWQAERAIGDHDRNTLRLRIDPQGDRTKFESGMTVWLNRCPSAESYYKSNKEIARTPGIAHETVNHT